VGVGVGGVGIHPVTANGTTIQRAIIKRKSFFIILPPIVQNLGCLYQVIKKPILGTTILHSYDINLFIIIRKWLFIRLKKLKSFKSPFFYSLFSISFF
jgi:hypothetical protein